MSGCGKVLDPGNDARVGRGAAACAKLQAAYFEWVKRGVYRPSLDMLVGQSGVPGSTLKNYYPRLSLLAAAVADERAPAVVATLGVIGGGLKLDATQLHALAYALLVGERFTGGNNDATAK